jgi:hypothetical protein
MRTNNKIFNIIEIVLIKTGTNEEIVKVGLLKNKKKFFFECKKEEFAHKLDKLLTKEKKIKIFSIEPAIPLSIILNSGLNRDTIKLKYTIARLKVYGFEFIFNDKTIRIQNLNNIVNEETIKGINPKFKFEPLRNYCTTENNFRNTLPEEFSS